MPARNRSWFPAAITAWRAFRSTCRASSSSAARAPDMQLLYEEGGDLKVAAVLDQAPASFQVETQHGRRAKVKATQVLLTFERPGGAELLEQARQFAAGLETEFLWQCSGDAEFAFQDLAREYVGRAPTATESAGVLIKLHSARCALFPAVHVYPPQLFRHEFSPPAPGSPPPGLPPSPADLPLAAVQAFSLDDIGTTEIDDAFSLERRAGGVLRVGIHIAAPGLGFAPGSPLDAIARSRLSTAYMPGRKFTMLPEDVIAGYSLDHGGEQAAVSLYFDVAADGAIGAAHSRVERVPVVANLRHAQYDVLNQAFEAGGVTGLAFEAELCELWRVAGVLEARRGKPSVSTAALDYTFHVEGDRVRIVPRRRGSPLDKLVAEMMIFANSSWGELLAERDVAAIYRVQSTGKVRFSVHPEPHEGLGLGCYAWMSSPLRRYVDLVNQWQLIAALSGRRAPFARNSDGLLTALRGFEITAARCDEHQQAMEDYWGLRWLLQEGVPSAPAVVLRESLARFEGLPLVARVPSLPALDPGTRVTLEIKAVDLIERNVSCMFREILGNVPAGSSQNATGDSRKA